MRRISTLFVFLATLASTLSVAGELELVLTVPVETKLQVTGVPDTRDTWLHMLAAAKKGGDSIDIEQFYVSTKAGEPMEEVLEAIRKAASKGVAVRLMVDKTFLKKQPDGAQVLANTENIEVRVLDYRKYGGGVQHSKFFVVNKKDAYLGSANFDWRALKHIHETGIRTQDAHVVTSLLSVFEKDWDRAQTVGSFKFPASPAATVTVEKPSAIQFAASPVGDLPADMATTIDSLVALIESARKTVQLQTMDYTTSVYGKRDQNWVILEKALIQAAKTKRVQLLVDLSKSSDSGLTKLTKAGVQVKKVEIPVIPGENIPYARLIHSKYLLIDGEKFWLGTDNMGRGYFHESRGVGVVTSDKTAAAQLSTVFESLWTSSYASALR